MKTEMIVKSGFTVVAFLLISTAASAQSSPASRTSHPAKPANQSLEIKPRDAQSGMPTGKYQRKSGAITAADYGRKAKDNVPAAKPQEPPPDAKKGENPLYENSGHSGTNPLYQSNRVNARPKAPVQEQPRQGDRVKGAPLKGIGTARIPNSNRSGAAVQRRKHLAGVKYQNRKAADTGSDSSHTRER